jgi:hypothetical protein
VRARGVHARNDEVGADVPLVAEEVLLQHRHARYDARLAAGREGVQLEVRRDDGGCEFRVGGGAGARAPDLGGNVVEFFAVLVYTLEWGSLWWASSGVRGGRRQSIRHTLSATMGPLVALVSAAMTTPPSNKHPTMVVPVLVAFGSGTPWACNAALRLCRPKSNPPILML